MKILNLLLLFFFSNCLFSIPHFSRKYEVSCSTCHTIAPDLNKKGNEFLIDGYFMGKDKVFEDKVNINDDFLYLPKKIPVSFLFNLCGVVFEKKEFNSNTGEYDKKGKADFQFPYKFKLLSGGVLYKNISYYLSFFSKENTSSSISDAYIYAKLFNDFPFYFKFGQFQTSDQLFKSNLREGEDTYDIYLASPNYSYTNLYYDKGLQFIYNKLNFDIIFGIYNGNNRFLLPSQFRPPSVFGDENISNAEIEYDKDLSKNYSFRIKKDFTNFGFGLFYYLGRENWELSLCEPMCRYKTFKNRINYVGFDFSLKLKEKFKLNGQYLERRDDNLLVSQYYYSYIFKKSELKGGFFEILFFPEGYDGRYVLSLLFNKGNSQIPDFKINNRTHEYYELDFSNLSFGLNYLISRNIKFLAELKRNFEKETNGITLGFFAFF